jgi:cyclohexanone monooxygenase
MESRNDGQREQWRTLRPPTLVNIRQHSIQGITATGVKTADAEYEVDAIVFATGFDAMTGALFAMNIEGKAGFTLQRSAISV